MQTPATGERDAAVTPAVIAVTRLKGNSCPAIPKELSNDKISERLLNTTGLLALERVEKNEAERQYEDLLQNANNSYYRSASFFSTLSRAIRPVVSRSLSLISSFDQVYLFKVLTHHCWLQTTDYRLLALETTPIQLVILEHLPNVALLLWVHNCNPMRP